MKKLVCNKLQYFITNHRKTGTPHFATREASNSFSSHTTIAFRFGNPFLSIIEYFINCLLPERKKKRKEDEEEQKKSLETKGKKRYEEKRREDRNKKGEKKKRQTDKQANK